MIKVSNGNHKIGDDTLIINMNSATDCPSRMLGLCQIEKDKCYAMKAEKQYPAVLPYRRDQELYWGTHSSSEIADALIGIISRKKKPVDYIRFSEAGDFNYQNDVNKMKDIARRIDWVTLYGYTSRMDLDFNRLPGNMVVNGSGFMVSNMFTAVRDIVEGEIQCPGDCRDCNLCKETNKLDIKVRYH